MKRTSRIAVALLASFVWTGLTAPVRGGTATSTAPGASKSDTSKSGTPWYVWYQQGLQGMANDEWAEAARLLEKAVNERALGDRSARTYGMWHLDYIPYFNLGVCYFYLGRDADALAALDKSETLGEIAAGNPARQKVIRIRKALQATRVVSGAPAASSADKPATPPPRKAEDVPTTDRLSDALSALLAGESDRAIELLQAMLRGREESAKHHYYLGLAYAQRAGRKGDTNPAIWKNLANTEFGRAIRLEPALRLPEGTFSEQVARLFREANTK